MTAATSQGDSSSAVPGRVTGALAGLTAGAPALRAAELPAVAAMLEARAEAAPRYRRYLEGWGKAGWTHRPNIGYSTVVYVDETDQKALDKALFGASRAYVGFLDPPSEGVSFEQRVAKFAARFIDRDESGAAEIMANIFDPDFLLERGLVFIGSPDTVAAQLKEAAEKGMFNTFLGEFNFHDLAEDDLMRSIRLFGEAVMPALRDFEPF